MQSSEQMHGALLAIRELIASAKELMIHRVKEVSENILKLKDFSIKGDKNLVKRTVIMMMPRLAAFSPEMFFRFYFKSCTEFLLIILNSSESERDVAFRALGEMLSVSVLFEESELCH
jgi:serine/threonine-protein kinase mTOR